MGAAALAALVIGLAILGSHRRAVRIRRGLQIEHLIATGHVFLVVGGLLGLVLPTPVMERATPLLLPATALIAGAIGLSVGSGFQWRVLRRASPLALGYALLPGVTAAIVVGGVALIVLARWRALSAETVAGALILAAAAFASSPTLAAAARRRGAGRSVALRRRLRMLELTAGIENLGVVVLAAIGFAVLRSEDSGLGAVGWLGFTAALGGVAGAMTWLLLGGRAREDERLLLGLAMVLLAAGIAEWVGLSAEAVCFCAGAVLVNLPGDRGTLLRRIMGRLERPSLLIVMILAGAYAAASREWMALLFLGVLTILRGVLRSGAGFVPAPDIPASAGVSAPRGWSAAAISQGNLSLVVAVTFHQVWPSATSGVVVASIAAAALLNEVGAGIAVLRAMRHSSAVPERVR